MARRLVLASTAASYPGTLGANDTVWPGALGVWGGAATCCNRSTRCLAPADVCAPARNLAWGDRPIAVTHPVKQFGDYRRLLENKDVDAVMIGWPDHWHVSMTRAAVNARKDVYGEKPITHARDDGRRGQQEDRAGGLSAAQLRRPPEGGLLGKVTMEQAYWYRTYLVRRGVYKPMDTAHLDWKAWLGASPVRDFELIRCPRWH